jgi:hypothetical protein
MPRVKRPNESTLELTAESAGQHNKKRKRECRSCDSGLAAKRLKALQTKLAEGQEKEGTSGGRKCEEPLKGTEKPESSSTRRSGFSKCGATTRLGVFKRKTILYHNIGPKQKCIGDGSVHSKKQHKSSGSGPELE